MKWQHGRRRYKLSDECQTDRLRADIRSQLDVKVLTGGMEEGSRWLMEERKRERKSLEELVGLSLKRG